MFVQPKPYISYAEMVKQLVDRGLTIPATSTEDVIMTNLQYIGYYPLSGYFWYFYDPDVLPDHTFISDVTWDDVFHLYTSDQNLRDIILSNCLMFERTLKALLVNEIGALTHDPEWIFKHYHYSSEKGWNDVQKVIWRTIRQQEKQHAYLEGYQQKPLEVWKIIPLLSFGQIVTLIRHLNSDLSASVSNVLNIPNTEFIGILNGLVDIRNTCAHSGRLWNASHDRFPSLKVGSFRPLFHDSNPHALTRTSLDSHRLSSIIAFFYRFYTVLNNNDYKASPFLAEIDVWMSSFCSNRDDPHSKDARYYRSLGFNVPFHTFSRALEHATF